MNNYKEYFKEFDYGVDYTDRMTATLLANGFKKPTNDRERAMIEYMKKNHDIPISPTDIIANTKTWEDVAKDIRAEMSKLPIKTKEENIKDLVEPTQLVPNFTLMLFEDVKLACGIIDEVLHQSKNPPIIGEWKDRYQIGDVVSKMLPEYEDWLQFLYHWGYNTPISLYPQFNVGGCYVIVISFTPIILGYPTIEFTDVSILIDRDRGLMSHNYSLQIAKS